VKPVRVAILGGGAVLSLALVAPFSVLLLAAGGISGSGASCGIAATSGGLPVSTSRQVGQYSASNVAIAGQIIAAGVAAGVDVRGQTIGVMTGIGESGLANIDQGDAVGPDSRGVFQQRAEGWGTYAERMDPYHAAGSFYRALLSVPGWESMSPTAAAHATQRNADPNYYEKFWDDAVSLVSTITGDPTLATTLTAQPAVCAPTGVPDVAGSYALPLPRANLTIEYVSKPHHDHPGADLPAPEGTPIYAVEAGTVTFAGPMSGYGDNFVEVRDAAGWTWYYGHGSAHNVIAGQVVKAGDQIASVGTQGFSTGDHLHLGLNAPGQSPPVTDPSYCPQAVITTLFTSQAPPALSGLSTTNCIGGHIEG